MRIDQTACAPVEASIKIPGFYEESILTYSNNTPTVVSLGLRYNSVIYLLALALFGRNVISGFGKLEKRATPLIVVLNSSSDKWTKAFRCKLIPSLAELPFIPFQNERHSINPDDDPIIIGIVLLH